MTRPLLEVSKRTLEIRSLLAEDRKRDLPSGLLTFNVDHEAHPHPRVLSTRVEVDENCSGKIGKTLVFDDSAVLADVDSVTGKYRSFEATQRARSPLDLPELVKFVQDHDDSFLLTAVGTMMVEWTLLDLALQHPQTVKHFAEKRARARRSGWRLIVGDGGRPSRPHPDSRVVCDGW